MVKTTVKIDGMACTMCEAHIKDTIRNTIPNAKKVAASHLKGEASFISDGVDEEKLKKAIDGTGYTFVSAKSEPYEKKGLFW
jgi:copper chaperone CopZ